MIVTTTMQINHQIETMQSHIILSILICIFVTHIVVGIMNVHSQAKLLVLLLAYSRH